MLPVVGRQQQQRVHRWRDRRLRASRARLGFTPSIQMVSELMWKNGAPPSSGSALTTPPPVPSSRPRSSEITICGFVRAARWRSICSAK